MLNYAHTLELTWDLQQALEGILTWLDKAAAVKKVVGDVSAAELAATMRDATAAGDGGLAIREPGPALIFGDGSDICTENESELGEDGAKKAGKATRTDILTKEGLDFLALGFTICKVAFVAGHLEMLPALVRQLQDDHR